MRVWAIQATRSVAASTADGSCGIFSTGMQDGRDTSLSYRAHFWHRTELNCYVASS
jgi:hypothetical protein